MADMVQRGEFAGEVIGLLIGGRGGGRQANVLGDHRERRQQGQRLEMGDKLDGARDRVHMRLAGGVAVGEEDHVELRPFRRLGHFDIVFDADIGHGIGAGMAPGGDMMPCGVEIGCKRHLPGHRLPPYPFVAPSWFGPAPGTARARS